MNQQSDVDGFKVLKPKPLKVFRNTRTGNLFGYSFNLIQYNMSANSDMELKWIDNASDKEQAVINKIRSMHNEIVRTVEKHDQAVKDKNNTLARELKHRKAQQLKEIDLVVYPMNEREYVESKEDKRFRLQQQNELKLDAGTIAALSGNNGQGVELVKKDLEIEKLKGKLAAKEFQSQAKHETSDDSGEGIDLSVPPTSVKKSRRKSSPKPEQG